MAALRRYDVLLVNPIRDGLNLVAKEGPLVNERDGLVLLSPEAGRLGRAGGLRYDGCTPTTSPRRPTRSAAALATPSAQRADRGRRAAPAGASREPHADWLADQLAAANA